MITCMDKHLANLFNFQLFPQWLILEDPDFNHNQESEPGPHSPHTRVKGFWKTYEQKRQRNVKSEWKIGRPWLIFDSNVMYCQYCLDAGANCSFTTGCTGARLEYVRGHENTRVHRAAVAKRGDTEDAIKNEQSE